MNELQAFTDTIVANSNYFAADGEIVIARAPGRLDVMGGIADYSGALVLELPLACATFAAVQFANEQRITVHSVSENATTSVPLNLLAGVDYDTAREVLASDGAKRWAAYVAG